MGSVNKVILAGNLGRDSELKTLASGTDILNFVVATTTRRKVQDAWTEVSEFHRCVLFGKAATALAPMLLKGRTVAIEGRLEHRAYEDQSGGKRYVTNVVVENVQLLGPARDGSEGQTIAPAAPTRRSVPPQQGRMTYNRDGVQRQDDGDGDAGFEPPF